MFPSVDSAVSQDFCQRYTPVIKEKGDSEFLAAIKRLALKQRIAANEVVYKCQCEKVQAEYCTIGANKGLPQ